MDTMGYNFKAPERRGGRAEWRWYRPSRKDALRLVVLSTEVFGYLSHWKGGRTRPCWGKGCGLCGDQVGRSVRYVLAVVPAGGGLRGLIELPEEVWLRIGDWMGRNDGLRGMMIDVRNRTVSKRSPIEVQYVDDVSSAGWEDAPDLDVFAIMLKTWRRAGEEIPAKVWKRVFPDLEQGSVALGDPVKKKVAKAPPVWIPPGPES